MFEDREAEGLGRQAMVDNMRQFKTTRRKQKKRTKGMEGMTDM